MIMKLIRAAVAALFAMAFAPLALAQELAPDVLMKRISDDVIESIKRDQGIQAGDAGKIAALVETKILPHFDFRRATRVALGANWRRATPQQQEELIGHFRTLLVRTYSGALSSYSGQVVEFSPLRAKPGETEVTVRSRIRQSGAEPIVIEYDMEKDAAGWKVFDLRISGISLVATYRSSFAEEVHNNGIDALIASLASKNRRGGTQGRAAQDLAQPTEREPT
jgi:phospholipid transport system substrate-binding protein